MKTRVANRITLNGTPYIVTVDEDGKERIEQDYKAMLAKLPVNQRIAAAKSNKIRYRKKARP